MGCPAFRSELGSNPTAPQLLNIITAASYIVKKGAFKRRDFINPSSSKVHLTTYSFPFYLAERFLNTVPFFSLLESRKIVKCKRSSLMDLQADVTFDS